jgi:hypothetical protein
MYKRNDGRDRVKNQDLVFKAVQASESVSTHDERRSLVTESVTGGSELVAPTLSAAWDPYEVWLTRVKRPRDLRVVPSQA